MSEYITYSQHCCTVLYCHINLCPTLCDPTGVAHRAPPSMGFSRQEYWSGLPCPPPGDLPDPGIEPESLRFLHWQVDSLPLAPPRKPLQWFEKNPKCINRWVLVQATHLLQKYIFYHYIIYHIKYICVSTHIHDKLRQRNKHSQENENQIHIHMTSSVRIGH